MGVGSGLGGALMVVGVILTVRAHVRQNLGAQARPAVGSGLALLGAVLVCLA